MYGILPAMTTAILMKQMEKKGFVMVPLDEYEDFVVYKKLGFVKEFTPTKTQINHLRRAEKNFKEGKTLNADAFARKMGLAS